LVDEAGKKEERKNLPSASYEEGEGRRGEDYRKKEGKGGHEPITVLWKGEVKRKEGRGKETVVLFRTKKLGMAKKVATVKGEGLTFDTRGGRRRGGPKRGRGVLPNRRGKKSEVSFSHEWGRRGGMKDKSKKGKKHLYSFEGGGGRCSKPMSK